MATRDRTCCFTGHRHIPENQYQAVAERLEATLQNLIERGVIFFGVGGALGFDTLAAKTVLRLKSKYPHIKLILVLPCLSQSQGWTEGDKQIYEDIKKQANKVVYTSEEYTKDCMFKRNRHLVDWSCVCVCYLTRDYGGTAYTVDYARRRGLSIFNLA